jgi:uncharacterized membrane protein
MAGRRIVLNVPLFGHTDPHHAERRRSPYPARELLNLELTILSEQKIAKVVALLEELRQDSPHLHNRVDELAEAMARPADPQSVIEAMKETRSESAHASRKADRA